MNYKEFIEKSQNLYEKIFNEKVANSLEYAIFAQGNPHPLRIKIEDELTKFKENALELNRCGYKEVINARKRRDDLKELERILMEFIEEYTN